MRDYARWALAYVANGALDEKQHTSFALRHAHSFSLPHTISPDTPSAAIPHYLWIIHHSLQVVRL